jgi:conjugal transfer/type IV secretion protein DotA/TraY
VQWERPVALTQKGWAGASLWYNRVAEINGSVTTAVFNIPQPYKWPWVMELVAKHKRETSQKTNSVDLFSPEFIKDKDNKQDKNITWPTPGQELIAPILYQAYDLWTADDFLWSHLTGEKDNVFIKIVNFIFGTSGLFSMRENVDIHPLAQLSALGKGMMEASIRNLAVSMSANLLDKVLHDSVTEDVAQIISAFAQTMATATLAMAFVLYYILPFLPFIYFIFAVSGWVKSIFEAIVAMPLWAMAHIRIDGEGIPARDATNGYFLLLEIFLRPILIIFGFIACINIFSSLVEVLNEIFPLIVSNIGGFDKRGEATGTLTSQLEFMRSPLDEFFFTAMYVIIVYMIGLSCFKLIDLIPNNILRWAGVSVSTFQEGAGDPAGQLIGKTYSGMLLATNKLQGGALAAILGGGGKSK